jgi:hypothetical protein
MAKRVLRGLGKKMKKKNRMGMTDKKVPFNWIDAGDKFQKVNKLGVSDFGKKRKSLLQMV